MKVNRFITHLKKLVAVEEALADFVALARKLGPALVPCSTSSRQASTATWTGWKLPQTVPSDLEQCLRVPQQELVRARSSTRLLDPLRRIVLSPTTCGIETERMAVGPTAYVGSTAARANIGAATRMKATARWADWILEAVAQRPQRLVLFQQRHPRTRHPRRADAQVDGAVR